MNNQKSIIGCGYIPRNVQAVCLKTNANTKLGEVAYKIIEDPYERVFERQGIFPTTPLRQKRMAVNVRDANTGLMYAVEYEPANLVRPSIEPKADKPEEKVEFSERANQIVKELAGIFSKGEISEKCGVAFFSISANGDGTTSVDSFLGGRADRIIDSVATCAKNPKALELVTGGALKATLCAMENKDDNE